MLDKDTCIKLEELVLKKLYSPEDGEDASFARMHNSIVKIATTAAITTLQEYERLKMDSEHL